MEPLVECYLYLQQTAVALRIVLADTWWVLVFNVNTHIMLFLIETYVVFFSLLAIGCVSSKRFRVE
jgi:hypothetical protein